MSTHIFEATRFRGTLSTHNIVVSLIVNVNRARRSAAEAAEEDAMSATKGRHLLQGTSRIPLLISIHVDVDVYLCKRIPFATGSPAERNTFTLR